MEISKKLSAKFAAKPKKSPHLHSPDHVLADELSTRLGEPGRFGFYLKMARTYNHQMLRKIAGDILDSPLTKKPGALFAYLIKKNFSTNQSPTQPHDPADKKIS